MLLYFVLKIITVTNLGVLASHTNIPSFLNPSTLSTISSSTQLNIYIYVFVLHGTCYKLKSVLLHRKGVEAGRVRFCTLFLFFSVHLLPMKDIRHDSPGDWSPLSTQKVQFCQQEGGTSLLRYFNSMFLSTMPWETSKSHQQKSKEWAVLRLTSQGSLWEPFLRTTKETN